MTTATPGSPCPLIKEMFPLLRAAGIIDRQGPVITCVLPIRWDLSCLSIIPAYGLTLTTGTQDLFDRDIDQPVYREDPRDEPYSRFPYLITVSLSNPFLYYKNKRENSNKENGCKDLL